MERRDRKPERKDAAMNKPLVIVLVLIALGLLIYLLTRGEQDTAPPPPEVKEKGEAFYGCEGTPVEEEPEFDVQVRAIKGGDQKEVEVSVTETHGWCVEAVYVDIWHEEGGTDNPELSTPEYKLNFLLPELVPADGTCVTKYVLNDFEAGQLEWEELDDGDLVGQVGAHGDAFAAE